MSEKVVEPGVAVGSEHVERTSGSDVEAHPGIHNEKHDAVGLGTGYLDEHGNVIESAAIQWTFVRVMAIVALCGCYVGSQIPLYFVGGALSYIERDLNATAEGSWLATSYALTLAATCPFVGYLTDLVGRRYVVLLGTIFLVIGSSLIATAHTFQQGCVGMAFSGTGAGICELTALAGVAEITPVKQRGLTLALVTFSILPFVPYVLYDQLAASQATWRIPLYVVIGWCALSFVGLATCYFPPPRHRTDGLTKMQIFKQIDFGGMVLSIVGITLVLVALQDGGYRHPWKSAAVLAPLIIGVFLILGFIVYEAKVAPYPMVPYEIFEGQRVVAVAFVVAFVAGMNFYALLNFYPLLLQTYYGASPLIVGLRGLPIAFAVTFGAVFVNLGLTYSRGHNGPLLFVATLFMTAFGGAMAYADPLNPKETMVLSVFAGIGVGGVLVPAATIAMMACPDAFIATTTALGLSVRALGGALGNSIYYNIFVTKLKVNLPQQVAIYTIESGFTGNVVEFVTTILTNPTNITNVVGVTPAALEAAALGVRWGYSESLKWVWLTSVGFGGAALVCCLFIPNMKRFMVDRVAVDIH